MAYSITTTIAKPLESGTRWQSVDLSQQTLNEITAVYREVRIGISNPSFEEPKWTTLSDIRALFSNQDQTLEAALGSLHGLSIPNYPGIPEIETKTIQHADAWLAGFDVKPIRMGAHPDTDWPMDQRRDLLLTKDGVDYPTLYKHALVSVNGLIHRTSVGPHGLTVIDGAYSLQKSNDTQISITAFDTVSELSFIDINETFLYRPNEEHKHYNAAYMNLGVSTENKTVGLVIGGYLHLLDNQYQSVGDGLIRIDFNNYPILQRYLDMRDVIDVSGLKITHTNDDERRLIVNEFISSESTIRRLLNLSQTFVVVMDTPDIYVSHHKLEESGLPGVFYHYGHYPQYPLKTKRGMLFPYRTYEDHGTWVLNCANNKIANYHFETTDWQRLDNITSAKLPNKPHTYDAGYLVEIGRDV